MAKMVVKNQITKEQVAKLTLTSAKHDKGKANPLLQVKDEVMSKWNTDREWKVIKTGV